MRDSNPKTVGITEKFANSFILCGSTASVGFTIARANTIGNGPEAGSFLCCKKFSLSRATVELISSFWLLLSLVFKFKF